MKAKDRLEVLNGRYRNYLEAERAILSGQSYSMGGVSLTRADLYTVRKAIADLEAEIMKVERQLSGRARGRIRVVVPADSLRMWRGKGLC